MIPVKLKSMWKKLKTWWRKNKLWKELKSRWRKNKLWKKIKSNYEKYFAKILLWILGKFNLAPGGIFAWFKLTTCATISW